MAIIEIPVQRRRPRLQFSLRTLFVFVLVAGAGLGPLAVEIRRVQRRMAAVAAMKEIPGTQVFVGYQHEVDAKGQKLRKPKPIEPTLLARMLGEEFGATVATVRINGPGAREAMAHLKELGPIEHLSISFADPTPVGPFGSGGRGFVPQPRPVPWSVEELEQLSRMTSLRTLELPGVTLAHPGVKHFKRLEHLETLQLGRATMYQTTIKNWQRKLPD